MRNLLMLLVIPCLSCTKIVWAQKGPTQQFNSPDDYQVESLNRAPMPTVIDEDKRGPTGQVALRLQYQSPVENSGVRLHWSFTPSVLDGKMLRVFVQTVGEPISYLTVRFLRPDGKQACRHTYFGVHAENTWKRLTFTIGGKGEADYFETQSVSKDERTYDSGQHVAGISIELGGTAGKSYLVRLSDFSEEAPVVVKRAKNLCHTTPTIFCGKNAVWLSPRRNFALEGIRLEGRWLEPSVQIVYPTFRFVNNEGKPTELSVEDRGWNVKQENKTSDMVRICYARQGTSLALTWRATRTCVRCAITVVAEGDLKIESVGAEKIWAAGLGQNDYLIPPDGALMRPATDSKFSWWGNGDNTIPNFAAVRVGNRILYYKPETFSQRVFASAESTEGADLAWLGGFLYFRPPNFKNPATRLVHPVLAWKVETAGDVNRDGEVDWVDCSIAYRDRYIKPNRDISVWLRDSYRLYHQYVETYETLAENIEKIDFATGCWWVKGAMVTSEYPASEGHPYAVEALPERADKRLVQERIRATGSRVGIYYGHDYIDAIVGKWPPELIKLDPEGNPHRYAQIRTHEGKTRPLYYKDNIRGLATGLLQRHYEKIIATVPLFSGDPVMLDTFTAFARPGYHPDYPATAQNETEAKHEVARWLKYDKRMVVAGEAVIEGTQDVVDYGAISYYAAHRKEFWRSDFPKKFVPLLTVIYHGSTLMGDSWYELRNPHPNWAATLAVCGGLWDWSSVHYEGHLYEKVARMFFNQNIFWARIANHRIRDINQDGTAYTIRFENGSILWTDPEKRDYWLEENSVRYHGFTPCNNKGVIAILQQDDFDVVLPVRDNLEVIPSQPHRDKLDVTFCHEPDGRVRVKGNFSKIPWKLPYLHNDARGNEVIELIEVAPVLMLRRKAN